VHPSFNFLILLLLFLLLTLLLEFLGLLLVVLADEDEGVQGEHAPHHRADVHCEHHVVVLGRETLNQLLAVEVGQEIYDLLQQEHDLVVGRQLTLLHVAHVGHDLFDLPAQTPQRLHLLGDAALQRIQGDLLDLPQEMLNSDLLRLSRLHLRLDVEEGLVDRASLGVDFLLSDECLGGQAELVLNLKIFTLCSTSTTRKTGLSVYFLKTSLIWMSCALKESPVVYHPTNFSLWLIYIILGKPFASCRTWPRGKDGPKTKCWTGSDLPRREWRSY
jgi:hypothetical protein